MDESLHYLLHEELEGLFDRPAAEAVQVPPAEASAPAPASGSAAPAAGEPATPPATATAATAPVSDRTFEELIARLADPKVLQALARLLGGR
ncbi:hypothetical protein [Lysobacter capsici]|jgi:hypothetical protein|uniref:hypothetical protein n=1 Tax=Lysobacter capsici TaxID=435897 RepID=UPI00287BBDD1|nr:hypothetical protein [Lysobacter capsici]WND81427.1 hypothetical protein RJ610_03340 [Lysobacter capsici]WND86623.1 hypothetical protein RJ609_03340 [Lysobacter capsici]